MESSQSSVIEWSKTLLRYLVGIAIGVLAVWLVTRNLRADEVVSSLQQTNWAYVGAAVAVILLTIAAKAWRWWYMFRAQATPPRYAAVLAALVVGQFLNLMLPGTRLGDVGRLLLIPPSVNRAEILGTLVLEKTLDFVWLVITLLAVLPFVALPRLENNPAVYVAIALSAGGGVYVLAYQSAWVVRQTAAVGRWLPGRWGHRLTRLVASGLAGLAGLRDRQSAVGLQIASAGIMVLSILTPLLLFRAFDMSLGVIHAAALNIVALIGLLPPTAPANIGLFEGVMVLALEQFGLSGDSYLFSYAVVYHAVVVVPPVAWGGALLTRTDWRWLRVQIRRLTRSSDATAAG